MDKILEVGFYCVGGIECVALDGVTSFSQSWASFFICSTLVEAILTGFLRMEYANCVASLVWFVSRARSNLLQRGKKRLGIIKLAFPNVENIFCLSQVVGVV